jgi:hypothetical protein
MKQCDAEKLLAVCMLRDDVLPAISPARFDAVSTGRDDEDAPYHLSGLGELHSSLPYFKRDVREASALHAQGAAVGISTSVVVPNHVCPFPVLARRKSYVQYAGFMQQV